MPMNWLNKCDKEISGFKIFMLAKLTGNNPLNVYIEIRIKKEIIKQQCLKKFNKEIDRTYWSNTDRSC